MSSGNRRRWIRYGLSALFVCGGSWAVAMAMADREDGSGTLIFSRTKTSGPGRLVAARTVVNEVIRNVWLASDATAKADPTEG